MKLLSAVAVVAGIAFSQIAAAAPPQQLADGVSAARLATPYDQRVEKLIDGRTWECFRDTCTAGHQDLANSQPLWMECGDAAAELGAFVDYRTGPDTLDASRLSRCNAHAARR